MINDKADRYLVAAEQIEALLKGETNRVGALANVSSVLHYAFPETFFWVGFYMVEGERLLLGPFQGTVACNSIHYGRGVCGTAWQKQQTIVVDDVEEFPGHIACSSLSRSEIVVPLFGKDKQVVGVLDIDSTSLSAFDSTDREWLEKIAKILTAELGY